MKRKLLLLSLFCVTTATFAANSITIGIKDSTFNPVPWSATQANGGFSLKNQTNKIQYVQVSIEKGEIGVFTTFGDQIGNCRKDLDSKTGPLSVVCELAPNEILNADIDYANREDASGTYQVEMDK